MEQDNDNGGSGGNSKKGDSCNDNSSSTSLSSPNILSNSNSSFEDMSSEDWRQWLGEEEEEGSSPEAYCTAIENDAQVCAVDGGFMSQSHFFAREHASKQKSSAGDGAAESSSGRSGSAVKALMKEYKKLMKGQLPEVH